MEYKANETAILLIEFQNDFCKPGFPLYPGVEKLLKENKTIENTVDLVKKARDKGVLILGIPIVLRAGLQRFRRPCRN